MGDLYLGVLTGSGLLVGLLAFGAVYLDTGRRGQSGAGRLLPAAGVGGGCFGGFLVPVAFDGVVRFLYIDLLKPRPVVTWPYEVLAASVATGLLVSAVVGGSYLVGTRYERREPTADGSR